jgi:hypothetical protein
MEKDNADLNINNYSLEDLIELIGEESIKTRESIRSASDKAANEFEKINNSEAVTFFEKVGDKLISHFNDLSKLIDVVKTNRETEDPPENILKNQYFDNGDVQSFLADQSPKRQENISVISPKVHMTQAQGRLLVPDTNIVNVKQGTLNPTLQDIYKNIINVDSQYREIESDNVNCDGSTKQGLNKFLGTSTNFTFDLTEPMHNVISMSIDTLELPLTWYTFTKKYGTTSFLLNGVLIEIEEGFYDSTALLETTLQTAIDAQFSPPGTITIQIDTINLKTTITDTTGSSLNLDFLPQSDTCNIENAGPKIDYNLGWLLGFRQPMYPMIGTPNNSYKSESLVNLFGTRYLILKVNDFQSNRITSGMTSLTNNQNKFKVPDYYNKIKASTPICREPDGSFIQKTNTAGANTMERSCRKGTQNPNPIVDGDNNLTNAQKYTAQQILISRKNLKQNRYFAPTDTDVLLRFPVDGVDKTRTIPLIYENNDKQKRNYFGPVTLKRLHVSLLNDKGLPIDLNGMDFSFSIMVEQIYQY